MSFCTLINCMDGRVQLPVIEYLKNKFGVDYPDSITEPGPVRILCDEQNGKYAELIISKLELSLMRHGSGLIAISAHYDCYGNPADETTQKQQLESAVKFISAKYPAVPVLGLWVASDWKVYQVCSNGK